MFRDLIEYQEIAKQQNTSYAMARQYGTRKDFPPCERVIGRTKFFNRMAVRDFFKDLERKKRKPPK